MATSDDNLIDATTAAVRREVYTGLPCEDSSVQPPHLCLEAEGPVADTVGWTFDIDSTVGFPSSLAVAKRGVRWHPSQAPISDLRSSLHLRPRSVFVFDEAGREHHVHRPVHEIPHYTFGRLVGFEDVSLYFLFPHLYRDGQQSSRLRDEDFRLWTDGVLLPIIY